MATVGEVTGITVNGKNADLSGINRDASNMVEVEKDKKILLILKKSSSMEHLKSLCWKRNIRI